MAGVESRTFLVEKGEIVVQLPRGESWSNIGAVDQNGDRWYKPYYDVPWVRAEAGTQPRCWCKAQFKPDAVFVRG